MIKNIDSRLMRVTLSTDNTIYTRLHSHEKVFSQAQFHLKKKKGNGTIKLIFVMECFK